MFKHRFTFSTLYFLELIIAIDNNKFANLDIKEKEELSKKVCSITNKMHGVINEDSILDVD